MNASAQLLAWRNGAFEPAPDASGGTLLVADSYLAVDGLARGWVWHEARFVAAATEHADGELAHRVWRAAAAKVPRQGRWFPRVELRVYNDTLIWSLWLRPAPQWHDAVRLWPAPADPREQPRVKGPDLEVLEQLRQTAVAQGADEALLVGPDGLVREAGYAALAWWRGGRLHVVDPVLPTLPSVTRRLLIIAAADAGLTVHGARPRLADLDGADVWLLNSGAGLRRVGAWVGVGLTPGAAVDIDIWRRRLDAHKQPLP